ncbi:hypothetical protein P43SY_007293 [Pythium insidiosum]|uniref:Uncharacterized protein n=1 Tax=Pythium insidiosum TaxID=114742 RepID=A0AAD5L7F3_PYTIN|nr:hypothetical protein P43SY_007293 [Pythium insidiosum]
MIVFPEDSDDDETALALATPCVIIVDDVGGGDSALAAPRDSAETEQEDVDGGPPEQLFRDQSSRRTDERAPRSLALSSDALCDVMDATLHELRTFELSGRAIRNARGDRHVLGWEDARSVDGTRVKFQLRKRFPLATSRELVAKTWQLLSDPARVLRRFDAGARIVTQSVHHVNENLQLAVHDALGRDDRCVVRCVYMLCRVRTPRGFLICVRSFQPPHENWTTDNDGRPVSLVNMLGWFRFDDASRRRTASGNASSSGSGSSCSSASDSELSGRRRGVDVECGGSLDFGEAAALATLASTSLWIALQWETLVVAPLFSVRR